MSSYVAFTRVTKKEDLLIFRPFDRELFNQGNQEGPELLLRALRGEAIDWAVIEAKHMPSFMCQGCDAKQFKREFSERQLQRAIGQRFCSSCEKILSCNGDLKQCMKCKQWLAEDIYDPITWRQRRQSKFWCNPCSRLRLCRGKCCQEKSEHEFSVQEWLEAGKPSSRRGHCLDCAGKFQTLKLCTGVCGQRLPEVCFTKRMWTRVPNLKVKCQQCCKSAGAPDVVDEKTCSKCQKDLSHTFYSDRQWRQGAQWRQCVACCIGPESPLKVGIWTCRAYGCNFHGDKKLFALWRQTQRKDKANGWEKCNVCFVKMDADRQQRELQQAHQQHIQKSSERRN